jgi:protein transport protein SEC39
MSLELSPAKLVLLAVRFASHGDLDKLSFLLSRHRQVLRKELVLRILLTYLSERTPSHDYVPFLQELCSGEFTDYDTVDIDVEDIQELSDTQAAHRVRALHLLPLEAPKELVNIGDDVVGIFLVLRAHRVDQECGLTQVPDLLAPFLDTVPAIRPWMVSTLLPLLRRNFEYHARHASPHTLAEFHGLPGPAALSFLLSQTGVEGDGLQVVGRDLRGMAGPWMLGDYGSRLENVLAWVTLQAQQNWRLAAQVFEQWDGPIDIDVGGYGDTWWTEEQKRHGSARYGRAGLATAYSIPETSMDGLEGAFCISRRLSELWGHEPRHASLESLASSLETAPDVEAAALSAQAMAAQMRGDLLADDCRLTQPGEDSLHLLNALITSAFLLTKSGIPCSVRRAGDVAFVHNAKEQKSEAVKLIHAIASRATKNDKGGEGHWAAARRELLWLQSWDLDGDVDSAETSSPGRRGLFGLVDRQFLETEFLKSLLASMRMFSVLIFCGATGC